MDKFRRIFLNSLLLVTSVFPLVIRSAPAHAQQFPSRTINLVTPVAPGSPFDMLARIFAEHMRQKIGITVIVENVTGGQGLIATQRVLNAKADGYTFPIDFRRTNDIAAGYENVGYKVEDFVSVAPLGQVPYILYASSAVPATDIPSFMSYMKANVKKMNAGVLTTSHLSMLLARKFGVLAGGDLTEIGYKGSGDMTIGLLANDIQMMATTYSVAGPHLASGKIKAIGVVAEQRTRTLPDLPTFKEKGYPTLFTNVWYAMFARADVPRDVLEKVQSVSQEIITDPKYNTAMEPTGVEPWPLSPNELKVAVDADTEMFKSDAETLHLKFD